MTKIETLKAEAIELTRKQSTKSLERSLLISIRGRQAQEVGSEAWKIITRLIVWTSDELVNRGEEDLVDRLLSIEDKGESK